MPYLILQTFSLPPTPISSSVQFSCSDVSDSMTPWTAARQDSLSITNSQSLLKLMSITSVMPSNYLILCRPLLLLPSIPPSIRVFSNESTLCMRWPKYWSFSFSIVPSTWHQFLDWPLLVCFSYKIFCEYSWSLFSDPVENSLIFLDFAFRIFFSWKDQSYTLCFFSVWLQGSWRDAE